MDQETATRITQFLINDLSDRQGLDQEWDLIDDETKEEIKTEWAEIIKDIATNSGY